MLLDTMTSFSEQHACIVFGQGRKGIILEVLPENHIQAWANVVSNLVKYIVQKRSGPCETLEPWGIEPMQRPYAVQY